MASINKHAPYDKRGEIESALDALGREYRKGDIIVTARSQPGFGGGNSLLFARVDAIVTLDKKGQPMRPSDWAECDPETHVVVEGIMFSEPGPIGYDPQFFELRSTTMVLKLDEAQIADLLREVEKRGGEVRSDWIQRNHDDLLGAAEGQIQAALAG